MINFLMTPLLITLALVVIQLLMFKFYKNFRILEIEFVRSEKGYKKSKINEDHSKLLTAVRQ